MKSAGLLVFGLLNAYAAMMAAGAGLVASPTLPQRPNPRPIRQRTVPVVASSFPTEQDKRAIRQALFDRRQKGNADHFQTFLQDFKSLHQTPPSQSQIDNLISSFHAQQQLDKLKFLQDLEEKDFSPTNRHAKMFGDRETDGLDLKRASFETKQRQQLNVLKQVVEASRRIDESNPAFFQYLERFEKDQQAALAQFERDLTDKGGNLGTKAVAATATGVEEKAGILGRLFKSFARP